jgi:beta-lactamase regulating signal transducer with metallopeptidase domain
MEEVMEEVMKEVVAEIAAAIFQSLDLSMAIKGTVVAGIGLVAVTMVPRTRASVRHLILAGTFGALFTLPFALALVPETVVITLPLATRQPSTSPVAPLDVDGRAVPGSVLPDRSPGVAARRVLTLDELARWAWGTSALAILASLCAALWRLGRIRRAGVPFLAGRELLRSLAADARIARPVDLLIHEAVAAPLTMGVLRPAIILPDDAHEWSEGDLRRALVHELEHVRRRDWAFLLVARITCAAYWFNPLVWIALRRMGFEAERACDDAVLVVDEGTAYAEQLVELARRMSTASPRPALAMAKRSDLSARISAILNTRQHRGRAGTPIAVGALSAVALAVLGVATLGAGGTSPNGAAPFGAGATVESGLSKEASASNRAAAPNQHRPRPLDGALYQAAEQGDIDDVAKLLDAGADVNAALAGDGSPLIGAARRGRVETVRLLLDRGADPDLAVSGDGNPLIMAAREGHGDVVELLLIRGARIDEVAPGDENALIQASGRGHLAIVKLLVARGADVNARVWAANRNDEAQGEWRTPLGMARQGRHAAVVSFLMSAGARD